MAEKTSIEWTRSDDGSPGSTWNPITGVDGRWSCVKISPGCQHCYAERLNVRFGGPRYVVGADELQLHPIAMQDPLRWRKPRRIFVASMTDLFEERVPDVWIQQVWNVMLDAPRHTYQVLTKRARRMSEWVRINTMAAAMPEAHRHIWLGVSVENQAYAEERIGWLLETPAAVRFLSVEPLLGPIDLSKFLATGKISWVIVGGESGGPDHRRLVSREGAGWYPTAPALAWVRSLRDQCVAAGVPFHFKQWGGPTPKSGGRMLDGREWKQFPDVR
jgi:protein gp37